MNVIDPTRYHFIEGVASIAVRTWIGSHAQEVWDERSAPGAGGPLNCLSTVIAWHRRFTLAGIRVEQLGRQFQLGRKEAGGYVVPGEQEPRDHHWLAVGAELALFDPTYGQFEEYGPPQLERYVTFEGAPFPEWRALMLGNG